jgi:hypothetical protein
MQNDIFNVVIDQQINRCTDTLVHKAAEYATDDRLHNFKTAAKLQGCTVRQAVAGMMAKHTVSVFDLCDADTPTSIEMWNEKITDNINYLLLLRAAVAEEVNEAL